ncbi:MAG: type II secretion system protein GspF [Deltaproteobacteria bacterium HGW-Deltaproteobacteria-15]|jgi:general secretion pathway protein F|nr:MAG: type II secretion system protein GspF [Deltaproteobacteria bacterium HGW-Deltaproteobacteria-15]
MPVFEYKALTSKGRKVGGIITAESPSVARFKLSQDKVFPVTLKEVKEEKQRSTEGVLSRLPLLQRINPAEVSTSFRQLATLVSSGLPLLDGLNGLIDQTEQTGLKRVFTQIRERVVEGSSLSEAMASHKSIFSPIHVNMVRAGEASGALDIILKRLADFSEKRMKLKKKIEAAMAYPIFLVLISSIILIFLMSFVMPKIIGIFEGMHVLLPWSTRFLIGAAHFMRSFWWTLLLGAGVCAFLFSGIVRTERGRLLWDSIRLRIPLLGSLHRKAVIARFTRTLSILLKSGIVLVDSIEIARLSMDNRILEEAVKEAARNVGEGGDFASPLKKGGFPPLVVQLIRAGEKSGELESTLASAAEVYEDDVEAGAATMTAILEPLIILVMGVMVGFMVMAVLLPIFDMTRGIR